MLKFTFDSSMFLQDVESKVGLVYALSSSSRTNALQSLQEEMLQVRASRDLVVLSCECMDRRSFASSAHT